MGRGQERLRLVKWNSGIKRISFIIPGAGASAGSKDMQYAPKQKNQMNQ
jgi:hypothetical protein